MTDPVKLSMADEMASMRTGMSFQRTRLAADRTLMSIMRTALSLISFGFTIHAFFANVLETSQLVPPQAPTRFGLALIGLGVGLLAVGIANHYAFMQELRRERAEAIPRDLVAGRDGFPVSLALIVAFLLLLVGLFAILSIIARIGPFS